METVTVSFELRGSDTSAETVLGGSTVSAQTVTEFLVANVRFVAMNSNFVVMNRL